MQAIPIRDLKKRLLCSSMTLLVTLGILVGSTDAGVYVIPQHYSGQIDAYRLSINGTIRLSQEGIYLSCQGSPSCFAAGLEDIDQFGIVHRVYLFITSQFSNSVEWFDIFTNMTIGCISTGAGELAGIDIDSKNLVVYSIESFDAGGNSLWAFDWDPDVPTLTVKPGYPIKLPSVLGAFGLAVDSYRSIVYIADTWSGTA